MKKQHIISMGQFLFIAFMITGIIVTYIFLILAWSELENFSTELMEDEEFSKQLTPECVENVVGLGWKSSDPNFISNSSLPKDSIFSGLFGSVIYEESGCNIIDLAENEALKDLYRHVPQWYVNGDFIWKLISLVCTPTIFSFITLITLQWPHKQSNKHRKSAATFKNYNKDNVFNRINNIFIWAMVAFIWVTCIILYIDTV